MFIGNNMLTYNRNFLKWFCVNYFFNKTVKCWILYIANNTRIKHEHKYVSQSSVLQYCCLPHYALSTSLHISLATHFTSGL